MATTKKLSLDRRYVLAGITHSPATQRALAVDSNLDVRTELATNPYLTEEAQQLLLVPDDDLYGSVYKNLAYNENLTEAVQLALLKNALASYGYGGALPDGVLMSIQEALAENDGLAQSVQVQLAASDSYVVRRALAGRADVCEHVQMILVHDTDEEVRAALCQNDTLALAEPVQLVIANEKEEWMCELLANNENLTPRVMSILLQDQRGEVRDNMIRNSTFSRKKVNKYLTKKLMNFIEQHK